MQNVPSNITTSYLGFDTRGHQTSRVEYTFSFYPGQNYFNFATGDCSVDAYDSDGLNCVNNGGIWTETRLEETPFGCVDPNKDKASCTGVNYWGWQARPTSANNTLGLCHVSYRTSALSVPLVTKEACEHSDTPTFKWYGEAGANCFYENGNSNCYDYLPLFK